VYAHTRGEKAGNRETWRGFTRDFGAVKRFAEEFERIWKQVR